MNLLAIPLVLATLLGADRTGTAVLPLLKIGQGPRASAMGESFTGLADDASAVYWNPAGLGRQAGWQLALSHHEWFAGIRDEIVHAALPVGPGAIGLGAVYTGESDVQFWNEETQSFESFQTWSALVTAGYGLTLIQGLQFGVTFKGMYEDLHDETGFGGGVDVGAVGEPLAGLAFGLAGRHLGIMSFESGTEQLPTEVAAGATFSTGPLKLTLDAVLPLRDNDANFRGGVEVSPWAPLAVRVGYRTGPVDIQSLGWQSGLTAGLGLAVGGIGVDYAFAPYGELGMTHRIGIKTVSTQPPGGLVVTVLDADTRVPVNASLAVSGAAETTAVTSEIGFTDRRPGSIRIRATADGYQSRSDTFRIVARRFERDTMWLTRLRSNLTVGIYDAKTKQPIGGTIVWRGPMFGDHSVPADPGTFTIADISPGSYLLFASGPTDDYLPQNCTLDVPPGEDTRRDFYLWRRGDFLVLEGVNFETGKADIQREFHPILDRAGEILRQTSSIRRVELAGHTDPRDINTNQFPSNWELSDARAKAVRQYLIEKWSIAPERLTTKGYADTQPVASNATFEGMAKNRRTELRILE